MKKFDVNFECYHEPPGSEEFGPDDYATVEAHFLTDAAETYMDDVEAEDWPGNVGDHIDLWIREHGKALWHKVRVEVDWCWSIGEENEKRTDGR